MSYKEVKQQYPTRRIKLVSKIDLHNYIQQGYQQVSNYLVDIWGVDNTRCYVIR